MVHKMIKIYEPYLSKKEKFFLNDAFDNNKIYTAVSLFSGMGGDTLGITQAGCRVIAYNELKPTFCKTHEANFPESELICDGKTNDISKLKDECFDKFKGVTDILFAGFPCFIKDTLVLTDNGYKQIQDVVLEDKLLTHTDQFQNIVNLQRKEYTGQLYNIKLKYHPELINCTEEHPFYVREQKKSDLFGEPKWKNASKLTMNDHFGMVINTKEEVPTFNFEGSIRLDHPDQWFIMGYFVGDHLMNDVNELDTNRCWFNIHDDDNSTSDKIKQVLEIKYNGFTKYVKNVSCNNVTWFNIRKQFDGKLIPEWIQNAPKHLIQEFINGYIAVSKSITEQNDDSTIIVTASYNLAYGFQRLYLKLGHIVSIDKIVNQRDTYQICVYTEKQRKQSTFIEGNYVWYAPSKIISNKIQNEPVYNFEVETDNSYIVCNTIVHNCQGFSTAGKKAEDDANLYPLYLVNQDSLEYEEVPEKFWRILGNPDADVDEADFPEYLTILTKYGLDTIVVPKMELEKYIKRLTKKKEKGMEVEDLVEEENV